LLTIQRPGVINFGDSRVCLMDARGGFCALRDQLVLEVGLEAEADLCLRSGMASGERLAASGLSGDFLTADEGAFRSAIGMFGSAGYGQFEVVECRWDQGWARIIGHESIEGWMFRESGTRTGTVCDYARGMLAGLMRILRHPNDENRFGGVTAPIDPITCVETACLAAGDDACMFTVGTMSALAAEGISGASVEHDSVRDTLLRLNRQLETILESSRKDPLTGVYNRGHFDATLRQKIGFAKRRSDVLSVAILDVDRFKSINDLHGHPVGDRVLRQFSRIIETQAREGDVVARFGGDEFVWLMPATPTEAAVQVAQRVRRFLVELEDDLDLPFTVSIGIAGYPRDAQGPAELMEAADRALYLAKARGRNRVESSDGVDTGTPRVPEPNAADSPRAVAPTQGDGVVESVEPVRKAPVRPVPRLKPVSKYRKVR